MEGAATQRACAHHRASSVVFPPPSPSSPCSPGTSCRQPSPRWRQSCNVVLHWTSRHAHPPPLRLGPDTCMSCVQRQAQAPRHLPPTPAMDHASNHKRMPDSEPDLGLSHGAKIPKIEPGLPQSPLDHHRPRLNSDFSGSVKKRLATSSRTGQACDRCKVSHHNPPGDQETSRASPVASAPWASATPSVVVHSTLTSTGPQDTMRPGKSPAPPRPRILSSALSSALSNALSSALLPRSPC